MPVLTALYLFFFFLHVDNMQMRSYGRPQGLLLHMKVRLSILCVSFHPFPGLMAGLDFCTQAVGGWLNKYLYQPRVESWTSSSLGCTDIWWQFIYLYSIWNLFHSKMGQLPIYGLFAYVFQAVLFYSIFWLLYSGRSSPTVLLLTPQGGV